eukprot:5441477-Pyramimonas_sp.AAC.2
MRFVIPIAYYTTTRTTSEAVVVALCHDATCGVAGGASAVEGGDGFGVDAAGLGLGERLQRALAVVIGVLVSGGRFEFFAGVFQLRRPL